MTLQEIEKSINKMIEMLSELLEDAHSDFQRERIEQVIEKLKKIQERDNSDE